MSETADEDRRRLISGIVENAYKAVFTREMASPAEVGNRIAERAFAMALDREKARRARRRPAKE